MKSIAEAQIKEHLKVVEITEFVGKKGNVVLQSFLTLYVYGWGYWDIPTYI